MPSPIGRLLDKVDWKCLTCGASRNVGCNCLLENWCPGCNKRRDSVRLACEPAEAKTLRLYCPDCLDAAPRHDCEPTFLNATGRVIPVDLEKWIEEVGKAGTATAQKTARRRPRRTAPG